MLLCVDEENSCEAVCEICKGCLCSRRNENCVIECTPEERKVRKFRGHYSTLTGVQCTGCYKVFWK